MIAVRIIKSQHCDTCATYLPHLTHQGYEFELYDGDADENQQQLDEWKIDVFPVIQIIYRDDNGNVKVEHQFPPGQTLAPRIIDIIKNRTQKKYDKSKS